MMNFVLNMMNCALKHEEDEEDDEKSAPAPKKAGGNKGCVEK